MIEIFRGERPYWLIHSIYKMKNWLEIIIIQEKAFPIFNDSSSEAQPSGIGEVFTEDSVMYYEYESGILRFPGARGPFTAALRVNASNAQSPQCGTTYLQRTINWVRETTMGIESEIAMAGCLVSTAVALAKTTAIKTLNIITVPVGKQQLITALFKTNKTKSSLISLGILFGLMDLLSEETQAMAPKQGDGKARSRRGSTAMNPTRKPKTDKDALATIKDLETRVTTQEAAISKLSKGKGKGGKGGKGNGSKGGKGGRDDSETRTCDRCGMKGGHKTKGETRFDGKYCFRSYHTETREEITTPKTPEAIAAEKEWKAAHPPKDQATKFAHAVETFKQMGKDEVEKKLNTTNTHLNQIELKVSKLLSEGTTPKDALTTVKLQEEALRVKKAQLNKALGAFVTHVTRYDLGDSFSSQRINSAGPQRPHSSVTLTDTTFPIHHQS